MLLFIGQSVFPFAFIHILHKYLRNALTYSYQTHMKTSLSEYFKLILFLGNLISE